MHRLIAIALVTCLHAVGCAPEQLIPRSYTNDFVRMESVVGIAMKSASNPLHHDLLEQGVVFEDLEDFAVPCVGLRVPMPGSDKSIFLTFTKEWFHNNSDEVVADSLINDLAQVLVDLETHSPSN